MLKLCKEHPIIAGVAVFLVAEIGLSMLARALFGPVACNDGFRSGSIGVQGACSWHHGVSGGRGILLNFLSLAAGLFSGFSLHSAAERDHLVRLSSSRRTAAPIAHPAAPTQPRQQPSQAIDKAAEERFVARREKEAEIARQFETYLRTDGKEGAPACPKCGHGMSKRTAKQGSYRGKEFWGCERFPMCAGIINIK